MLRRAECARRHGGKAIGRAFLFQCGQDGSSKWTTGNGMDDKFGHNDLLHLTMGVGVLTISARWAGCPLPNLSGSLESGGATRPCALRFTGCLIRLLARSAR